MKKYSVLLSYPDPHSDETHFAWVVAESIRGAVEEARNVASVANGYSYQPEDFGCVAVFNGHIEMFDEDDDEKTRFRLTVPVSMTDDYNLDFNLCIFDLKDDFFEEVRRHSSFVAAYGLESVTKLMGPPGFYFDPEDGSELEKIDFKTDRVTLNITARSVYWSGIVFGKHRDTCWKTQAVPLSELLVDSVRDKKELDYRG
ncbi:hypothetical protein ACHHRT_12720 [Desulfurivibrio sp. D14AmB]|uniref:hypothetical protein n=1 Tax=Desulfurivibrio sp. D14AmB TaxID=3374370 RepID=UPI00376EC49E